MIDRVIAARATPLPSGSPTTIAATWVIVNTKTRSKNSSSVDTRIGGSADEAWWSPPHPGDAMRQLATVKRCRRVLRALDLVDERDREVLVGDVFPGRTSSAVRYLPVRSPAAISGAGER